VHTALIGVDVTLERGADAVLPLEGDVEHAVVTVSGAPEVDGGELEPGSLCYLLAAPPLPSTPLRARGRTH
jgi:quercetin 2,3-dioxygenase